MWMPSVVLVGALILASPCRAQDGPRPEDHVRTIQRAICELKDDPMERELCLLRLSRPALSCSSKATAQEQIRCLEGAIDGLINLIPSIVADQVQKQLAPRIHK